MSTYTYRFYEVKTAIVHDSINRLEDFEEKYVKGEHETLPDGYTVKVWNVDDPKFRIWNATTKTWEAKEDCRHEWVLLRWYTKPDHSYSPKRYDAVVGSINLESFDPYCKKRTPVIKVGDKLQENVDYCDNGGIIRDEYISHGYGLHDTFADRGYPTDMSEELKAVLKEDDEYSWGHTYVYLSEWSNEYDKRLEEFKRKLEDIYKEDRLSIIEKKIDLLEKKMKDPFYEEPVIKKEKKDDDEYDDDEEETLEERLRYLWDEEFMDLMSIKNEIRRAYHLIDQPFGWTSDKDIRITYFLA